MINNGIVLDSQNLVSQIARYYEGVIQVLIIVMTLLGVVAFTYVKTVSADQAEEGATEAVRKESNRYFASKEFHDLASKWASEAIEDEKNLVRTYVSDLEQRIPNWIDRDPNELDDIQRRLDDHDLALGSFDTKESEKGDLRLEESKDQESEN
jgi:Tfp pilus assembly protein PilO